MSFSVKKLFSNLFLSVVLEGNECIFFGQVFRNGKLLKTINAKFTDINIDNIDEKIIKYIEEQEKTYFGVYVSVFFNDDSQGALPSVSFDEYKKFNINTKNLTSLIMQDSWSIYANLNAIKKYKNLFGQDSVDLGGRRIIKKFHELLKRGISPKITLYLYIHAHSFTLAIFKDKQMKLSTFLNMAGIEETNQEAESLKEEDITDIDNLIIKEENDATSLDDFKSLDDFLSDDKPKEFEDLNYELNMPVSTNVEKSVAIFGYDMKMFDYIVKAVKEFYENPLYGGDFIEQIIVFENTKTSATFLQYLQSELLVETSVYPVNTNHIMNEIMQEEIVL